MSDTLSNDTRQEANAALMEVEKGLRSSRVGDQCEAIVKFPSLIDRFPFPILINAAYLKLAEVYRTSINFLRLNILKVLQVTEKHLNKITSVDEFLRRLYAVIHSNDPIARAVTLRVFGSIASIVADRKNIHHSIHHGLESNDQVEAGAAIYATHCLCEHSAIFAAGVYDKIATMIQGLTTPVEKKLSLIPILELMHHDIWTTTQVRELCVKLLPSHPSLSMVSALLHTLTTLTLHTRVHTTDQVKLLLYYAQGDGRKVIRQGALSELNRLASQVPHMWSKDMIQGLSLVVDRAGRDHERALGLRTLNVLSNSAAVHNMTFLKDKLLPFVYSLSAPTAIYSLGVVTNITVALHKSGACEGAEVVEVVKMVTEVCLLTDFGETKSKSLFKVMLGSLVELTAAHSEVSVLALECLLSILPLLPGTHASLICQALVSIALHTPTAWSCVTPKLMEYLESAADPHEILLSVTAVVVQLFASESSHGARDELLSSILPKLFSHLWQLEHPSRLWLAYKMARRASMMGIHEIAMPIYSKLSKMVTSVKYRNWLSTLHRFSEAQTMVLTACREALSCTHLIPTLSQSSTVIHNAMMLIKTSSPPSSFGLQFLSAHAAWLSTHCQLLATCVSLSTIPPPSTDLSHGTEKKFQLCVSQFQLLSRQYDELYSTLFDADPSTLEYITLLQQSCLLMASIISSITCSRRPLVSPGKPSTPSSSVAPLPAPVEISDNFNTKYLLGQACRSVYQKAQSAADSFQNLPVGEEHSSVLTECCQMILSVPICLPHYFFTSLQQTSVKLALSPPIPQSGHPVTLTMDTHLTLKVEGVIEHAGKAKMYRSLSAVYVRVNPTVQKLLSHDVKTPELKTLERTEPVEKDYFQAQFVLTLPTPGHYTVRIEASLLDNEGTLWQTRHKETLAVLVNIEEGLKQKAKDNPQRSSSGEAKQSQRSN